MPVMKRLKIMPSISSGEAVGVLEDADEVDEESAQFVPAKLSGVPTADDGDGEFEDEAPTSTNFQREPLIGAAFPLPDEADFNGEDFREAPELEEIALQLIYEGDDEGSGPIGANDGSRQPDSGGSAFDHLRDVNIGYLWKLKGGASGGKLVLAKTSAVPALAKYYASAAGVDVDFVIAFSWDNLRPAHFTRRQIEALMYHELCHLGWDDEKEKVKMIAHDFTVFNRELQRYGAWDYDIDRMIRSARNLAPEQLSFGFE